VTHLEQKLGIYTQGPARSRRNAALDILTGRPSDEPVDASSAAMDDASLDVDWTSDPPASPASPVHAERDEAPTRRMARGPIVVGLVVAGVLMAAGFGLRGFVERPDVAVPPLIVNVAAVDTAPVLAAVPVEAIAPPVAPIVVAPIVVAPEVVAPVAAPVSPPPLASASVPTSVLSPSGPAPANRSGLLVDERFTSTTGQWPNDPQGTAWFGGGSYRLAARKTAQFVAVGIPGAEALGDSVVTGWFRKVGGLAGGGYGLILRDQDPQTLDGQNQVGHFYVFEVGDRGDVGVWLRDGDSWVDLLTWTPSDAVKPGLASNQLSVTMAGDRLSFVVNGIPVASQMDSLFHGGAAGVFVGGDTNEVALDRIAVSVPL
jgi:hypothetical protein